MAKSHHFVADHHTPRFDEYLDHYNEKLLAGEQPILDRDVLLEGGLTREEASGQEITYAVALTDMGFGATFGVFSKHIGGGAGWGVYAGPQDRR